MTVRSEEKNVLDAGSIPAVSNNETTQYDRNLFFTEREWSRTVGWGNPPVGTTGFDKAQSIQTDSSQDDWRNQHKTK